MPRANVIQTNFTAGELSPHLRGRVDFAKYFNGVRLLKNFIVRPQGGVMRREGTKFIGEVKNHAQKVRLVPFIFSTVQPYLLEFGHLYMRVYRNGGIVESSPGVPVEIVTPWTEEDLPNLSWTQSADILYVACRGHRPRVISRTSHTSWTIAHYPFIDGPYLLPDESGIVLRIETLQDRVKLKATVGSPNFTSADINKHVDWIFNDQWQVGKIVSVESSTEVTVDRYPNVLSRVANGVKTYFSGSTLVSSSSGTFLFPDDEHMYFRAEVGENSGVWQWRTINAVRSGGSACDVSSTAFTMAAVYGPYGGNIHPAIILTQMGRRVSATCTASSALFTSNDVGRFLRLRYGKTWVACKIASFNSSTSVSVRMDNGTTDSFGTYLFTESVPLQRDRKDKYYAGGVADSWRLGAWGASVGWPELCTFHKQRIIWARTISQPQTLWFSMTGDFDNFAPSLGDGTVLDTSSIDITLASGRVNPISWVESGPVLLVGTQGGIWQMKPSNLSESITPTNIEATEHIVFGAQSAVRPQRIGSATLFAQHGGKKLRELKYNFEIDALIAVDISILCEHLFSRRIVEMALQKEPVNIAWCRMLDGSVIGITYEPDHEVIGAHQHTFAGGICESVAVIPTELGDGDEVYFVMRRIINGNVRRYIEVISSGFDSTLNNMFFVESGLSYNGPPATVITGLNHLEGQIVDVVADGVYVGQKTVTSGAFTLTNAASVVHAGLPSSATIHTLDIEGGSPVGTSQGKMRRIDRLTVRVLNSLPFKFGTDLSDLLDLPTHTFPSPLALISTDIRLSLNDTYRLTGGYYIHQTLPYPLTILALMPSQEVSE